MKKMIVIAIGSCLVSFLMSSCSQNENTYGEEQKPTGYSELSNIEYQYEEDVREIRHEIKEGFNHSGTDAK